MSREEEDLKDFIKEMKILLIKLEYEDDKDTKMDIIDSIHRESRQIQANYCTD